MAALMTDQLAFSLRLSLDVSDALPDSSFTLRSRSSRAKCFRGSLVGAANLRAQTSPCALNGKDLTRADTQSGSANIVRAAGGVSPVDFDNHIRSWES